MSPVLVLVGLAILLIGGLLFVIMRHSPQMDNLAEKILTEENFSDKNNSEEIIKKHKEAERSLSDKTKEIEEEVKDLEKEESKIKKYNKSK